ncbi:WD40/YVTN/BNR-like repeat-containing protein [Thalassotalea euphylliae]|uniref:WD40/YVTN/BNR-like repeat-containing protein n=1 Tax=Thalassotalea euphylliae TaxID=1655234 RepID=UPI00363E1A67
MNLKLICAAVLGLSAAALPVDAKKLTGKSVFGDLEARHVGPALMSGRIGDLEMHPTNSRIIYAGAAGGGVWKSINGGATFKPIFDEHPQSIGAIELDPNDPDNTVWVGTGEIWTRNSVSVGDGLFVSKDGGANWTQKGFEGSERISSVVVNPKNSKEIYVGVLGALWGDSKQRGVYKSVDGGDTWEQLLYIDETTGCSDVVMDPSDPNVLYASMWEFRRTAWSFNSGGESSALYKSTDAGKTWNKIHNGFPEGKLGRIAVAVAPSDPNRLYSVLETEKDEDKGLYRSDDGGKSWQHLNGDFGLVVRPFYFSRIVVDPQNPDILVKGGLFGSISRDGGATFKDLGRMHADIHDAVFDPKDSERMYVATDGGVYRTWDGGSTMEIVENIPVSQFYHISVDNAEPYNIYGGLQDNGSWYGPSSSPGGVEARDWNSVGYGDGFRVLKHATKPIVYSEMQGAQNVWRLNTELNQVKTIQPLPEKGDPKLRFNWNAPIELSPNEPDRLYMGSQFVHVSEDMGSTWKKISPDLTTNDPAKQNQLESGGLSVDNSGAENHSTIFTIAESSLDEDIIWVGTDDGNVQVTKNGGKKWQNVIENVPNLPKHTWVSHIEASVHDKGTAYAVFDGHTANDSNTYVYKTTDFGKTWTSLAKDNIKGFARNIQEDYENPNLLFLGTEFGLYITLNGGQDWLRFTNNMPATAVHYIELQKQTNDLVLGTHGRGIIILDDISPLRELSDDVLNKKFHFFASEPTIINEENGFGGGSTETQFVGQNASTSAQIKYFMKKRHIFGKVKLEVFDEEGNKVADLPAGKAKGINVVDWNYHLKPPKIAKGKTWTFGGFTAPRVSPGVYNVVMTKGKEVYETKVELIADPDSPLSKRDRKKLHKTTMKLYDMTQELAYLVYQIDEHIALAEKQEGEQAIALTKALNTLKETLVITTGDNYVGSAEPQLREKLADLYSKVTQGFEVPSKSEMANLALLTTRFDDAKKQYGDILAGQADTINGLKGSDTEGQPFEVKTYDEFVAE